ncbi:MAG: hypothetical protein WD200_05305 [Candidatus Andersenbacteria bacterium]
MPVTPTSIIKSRIAENIVELLLEESNYKVTRIGTEGLLSGINRRDANKFNQSDAANQLKASPSFVVIDKSGRGVALLKIRFRGARSRGGNIDYGVGQLQEYWPAAQLVVVSAIEPHFTVMTSTDKSAPIEEAFTQIKQKTLAQCRELIQKFLV